MQSLRTWGELGVVKLKTKSTAKLENCGEVFMFVVYAEIHNYGVYRMANEATHQMHVSRYAVWLKRMFFANK